MMKTLRILIRIIIVIALVAGVIIAAISMRNRTCKGIEVALRYEGECPPVSEQELCDLLASHGIQVEGQAVKDIDLKRIHDVVSKNDYIDTVYPIYFAGSKMQLKVKVTEFLAHVFPDKGDDYYLCRGGKLLPYSAKVCEPMLLILGDVPVRARNTHTIPDNASLLKRLYKMAETLNSTPLYKAQFKQLYYNQHREFELTPSVGKQTIRIGSGRNLEEQLTQLCLAYEQGISYMDPARYAILDLRYKNRIIAIKR